MNSAAIAITQASPSMRRVSPRPSDMAAATSVVSTAPPVQCFDAEVLPHRRTLRLAALHLTRNPNDADDLVQDTMLRAYRAWHRYVPGSNCRAWLLRILKNGFINNYRSRRRHQRFSNECRQDAIASMYGHCANRYDAPEKDSLDDAFSDEVTAALDSLNDDYRRVVEMADLHGIRYKDIAHALEVPIGTVMSRLFRARRQLEQQLTQFAANDYGIRRAA